MAECIDDLFECFEQNEDDLPIEKEADAVTLNESVSVRFVGLFLT